MQNGIIKRLAVGATTLVAAAGVISLSAGTANASDPDETFPGGPLISDVHYDVSGTAAIKNNNAKLSVPVGPTRITADTGFNDDSGTNIGYYASLPLPPKNVSFKAFGYLPVTAKVSFTQVGPATGSVTLGTADDGTDQISGSAQYVVSLSNVIVGYSKANVGTNCQTRYPAQVNFASTKFGLFDGGDLTGTVDIGKFNNCGTSTDLANIIVPGNGNVLKLHLGSLYIGDDKPSEAKQLKQFRALAAKKK